MDVKWDKIFENEKRQFEKMSELDKFIYFLLLQFGSPMGGAKKTRKRPIVRGRYVLPCTPQSAC
jgi:hypothetical protein